ncbi:hypothetical protein M5X11_07095 [Paenibacillus alginolyticus]|uniref:Nucleotidyl transferase AbiEii toxin, Type IV TA system n=1 Tax=Paenibacillus alginolyticus TaxID=59839 RepID=A0ABT4GD97_9BACL|nr:hypothetical protein [Paenibacillus alginolyticus]MCY9664720.1 hypothetical protein [Paenibacillus alginolyticus]MCY9694038.1 hypothetical protein [Paenibacillus alginolyticus]
MVLLEPLLPTITTIHTHLLKVPDVRWLIGGSCGLLFQNVDIGRSPRDLDIYVDDSDVIAVHTSLLEYSVDAPIYSETPIYASILSHYHIGGNAVEVVGDFRVNALHSSYQVEASYLWENHSHSVMIDEQEVKMMPLAHELLFNLLRNRPDRYEAIARTMKAFPEMHMQALSDLMQRNHWGSELERKLEQLIDSSN